MRTLTLTLAACVLVAAGSTAPVELLAQDAGQQTGQQAGATARIQATMNAAAEAGIPVALLESKLEEGRAKGVAEARIAAALETRLEALARARAALEQGGVAASSAGELSVAADALEAGVSESALVSVQAGAPGESRAVATAVLASLVQLGVASEQALTRVRAALDGGPGALAELRAETNARLRARGLVPPVDLGVGAGVGVGVGRGGGPGGSA